MSRLTNEQIEELRQFDTPTIYNAIKAFKTRSGMEGFGLPGLHQLAGPEKPMCGYAVTCKVDSRYPMKEEEKDYRFGYYAKIRECDGPAVAVVQDMDPDNVTTFWGEVQATTHIALGAVGTLCEGTVRDIPPVNEMGFYFFAKDPGVASGDVHVVDYDCPVVIRGLEIKPGDLIFADVHGFTVIPEDIAPKLAKACKNISDAELPVLTKCREYIKEGKKPELEDLKKWRSEMAALRKKATE